MSRSGFKHVRLCNDCRAPIGEDNSCGCPSLAPSPYQRGVRVTVCADNMGEQPTGFGVVARIGNGAFRIAASTHWYHVTTGIKTYPHDGGCVRLPRDGDETAVAMATLRQTEAAERAARLAARRAARERLMAHAREQRMRARDSLDSASEYEQQAYRCSERAKEARRDAEQREAYAQSSDRERADVEAQLAALEASAP